MTLEVILREGGHIEKTMSTMARSLKAMDVKGSEFAETKGKIMIHCNESDCIIVKGVVEGLDMVESVELRA